MSNFFPMRGSINHVNGLKDLISYIDGYNPVKELIMIEIGSYIGESTTIFANSFKTVISVDPYIDNYDLSDHACKCAPFSKVYEQFLENTKNFTNIKQFRKTSDEAIKDFQYNSVDFVYIDGNHMHEFVKRDIENYWKILKHNGFLGGHDYHSVDIKQAIQKTIGNIDRDFIDRSWIKRKSLDKYKKRGNIVL
jgi:hypothetical protein